MYSKQKSLNFGQYVPNDEILNKKVPENPRYKNVRPAIDTGKNIRKQIDDLKEKQKSGQPKKNEVFKRIKCSAFLKLVIAVATERLMNENSEAEPNHSAEKVEPKKTGQQKGIANVLMGIGELDLVAEKKKMPPPPPKPASPMPYLLLDVRDWDSFTYCHIITAKSYPSAMLSRSTGSETEDLMQFKHLPHNVIILYDEDETIATRVATTLVERGYDNIFVLAGGLKLALEICPKNLTSGQPTLSPSHAFVQNRNMPPKTTSEFFSKEDVESIENQMRAYQNKVANHPSYLSMYSLSSCTSSSAGSHRLSRSNHSSVSSCASSISGRQDISRSVNSEHRSLVSASSRASELSCPQPSLKNTNRTLHKAITRDKPVFRKAPWK